MEEADFLCDRIGIMDNGTIVAMDSPERLKNILGGDVVTIEIDGNATELKKDLESRDWIRTLTQHENCLSLTLESGERRIPAIIQAAQEKGVVVACVQLRKPSLEDVFLHFTGRTIREQEASQAEKNINFMHSRMGRRR